MTLMAYQPIEVYRAETKAGFSFDVRYQLSDRAQFHRAAGELAERERMKARVRPRSAAEGLGNE